MKAFGLTLRVAGATLLLMALQALWGRLWGGMPFTSTLRFSAFSCILIVLALSLVASSSQQYGWTLSGTLFILYFGINGLNTLHEALLFKIGIHPHEVFRLMVSGLCTALILAPLLVLILGCWKIRRQEENKPLVPRSALSWMARIVLGDFLYIFCYVVAGVALFPYVKEFYAGFELPGPAGIVEIEILRGLVYVAAGLAAVHGMKGRRGRAAATLALAFPILAGVAPVLLPNPYLPASVQLAHGFEVGISNLGYGALLGYLLARKAAPAADKEQAISPESSR